MKAVVTLGIGVAAVLGFLGIRLLWAARIPSRPKAMPQTSIWVPGPPAPLDLSLRGVWLGCWLDETKNVNHCKVTDYKGNAQFDEDFLPVNGHAPIAHEHLHLKQIGTLELWTWIEEDKRRRHECVIFTDGG
jgi:hypothetical protein